MINKSNWLLKEIPQYHPLSNSYIDFWRSEKKKCIEGMWVSGYWMPGKLYFYINYGTIRLNKPNSKVKTYGRPWLRDLEWEFFYNWSEARGFSGFEDDTEISCNELIKEYTERPEDHDIDYLKKYYPNIFTSQGQLKKYEPASSYLRRQHHANLGKPLFENQAKNLFMLGSRGFGKALANYHEVPLATGRTKKVSEVVVGDLLISRQGLPTKVLAVYPQGLRNTYKLTFADGRTVVADEDHLWSFYVNGTKTIKTVTTKDIAKSPIYWTHKRSGKSYKYHLPEISAVQYPEKDLLIHPYLLGALIGDGTTTGHTPKISSNDSEIIDKIKILTKDWAEVKLDKSTNNWTIVKNRGLLTAKYNPLTQALKQLDLQKKSYDKCIPEDYLYASEEQRLELLRGLLDTDGSITSNGSIEFTSVNKKLAEQVLYLCRGLGIRAQVGIDDRRGRVHTLPQGTEYTTTNIFYRVFIRTDKKVFFLSRKLDKLKKRIHSNKVALVSIEPHHLTETTCFTVDNEEHLFLVEDYIPTHNSYTSGVGLVLHEWLFDGKTQYVIDDEKSTAEIAVAAGDAKYSKETLEKTKMALEQLPGGQEIGGLYYPPPFSKQYRGSWIPGKDVIAEYRKKVGTNWEITGTKSSIKHRTFKDNPFALNGTRLGVAIFEEVGMFSNLKESYNATVETQRDGAFKFGSMLFIGTGGDMAGGSTLDAQEMFYNPEQYDCLPFKDTWEYRATPIGYFIPAYLGLNQFKDDNGITNVEQASKFLERERDKLKRAGSSISSLEGEIVNRPLKPSEMFLQRQGNIFPILELRKRLSDIENSLTLMEKKVSLYFDPEAKEWNGVNYKIDTSNSLTSINKFPWTESQKDGCIVIYEFPQIINDQVPEGAYIIGHDPYANDDPNGDSLAATFVLKTKKYFSKIGHDEIVAAYVGRPYEGRHIVNENLYKLSKMYGNAKIYFENVRGNVKEYFEKIKRLDLLATQPKTVLTKTAAHNQTSRSIVYGYPMSSRTMKNEAIQYVRDWLLEERDSKDGIPIRNLDRIWDKALLQELIAFNMDGNFDRVMGLAGCIIGLTETFNQYNVEVEQSIVKNELSTFLANNKFVFG